MKCKLTFFAMFISLIINGQSLKNLTISEARIIAIDSTRYHESIINIPNSYFLLIEILDKNYDTTIFCKRRFVTIYEANSCDLKEGFVYELEIEKQSLKLKDDELISNYLSLLKQNTPNCFDPIFYLSNKNRFLIVKWK